MVGTITIETNTDLLPHQQDALETDKVEISTNPYFNVSDNTEQTWGDLTVALAKSLHARGLISTSDVSGGNGVYGPGDDFYGYLRVKTVRLLALGWKPTATYGILESMDQEVEAYLDVTPLE